MIRPLDRVEGNVVGDIVTRGTEKWVFVTAGTKELRLFPSEYLPLHVVFRDYNITDVEGKRVYILTLEGEILSTVPEVEKGLLTLRVEPTTASVMIDGRWRELDEKGLMQDSLIRGTYNYSVMADGYVTLVDTVTVGEAPVERTVVLDKVIVAEQKEKKLWLGIEAGVNLANGSFKGASTKMAIGFFGGFAMRYDFTPHIGLSTGLQVSQKGFKMEDDKRKATGNPLFMQIPIEFSYGISKVRFHAGPYGGFGLSGKLKTTLFNYNKSTSINFFDRYSRIDMGVRAGVGLDLKHFGVGATYELGFTGYMNRNIQIGLTYLF
jgi:hypothetical protein